MQSRTSLSFKIKPLVVSVATVMSAFAAAEDTKTKQQTRYMEEITIVGTQTDELAGSAFSVDKERLEVFNFSDINQILAEAPGVYTRAEDGYGLRPNIGIRGAGTDRSDPRSRATAYYGLVGLLTSELIWQSLLVTVRGKTAVTMAIQSS